MISDGNCPTIQNTRPFIEDTDLSNTVRSAQCGNRDAFGRLAERYQRTVYGIAYRRLQNHSESQELCQDVFIQAMQKLGQLVEPGCFGAWVRSIANRMAINRAARRRPTESAGANGLDAYCVERETPLSIVLGRERTDRLRQGLRRLRALDRKTLTAFYFDGHSLVEMSAEFGSPVGTIKRRLHVARKRLAKELEAMTVG